MAEPAFSLRTSGRLRRRQLVSRMMGALAFGAALLAISVLAIVVISVASRGASALSLDFFTKSQAQGFNPTGGGILFAIVGSVVIVGIATLIALPLGVLVAIYISELAPQRLARVALIRAEGPSRILGGILTLVCVCRRLRLNESNVHLGESLALSHSDRTVLRSRVGTAQCTANRVERSVAGDRLLEICRALHDEHLFGARECHVEHAERLICFLRAQPFVGLGMQARCRVLRLDVLHRIAQQQRSLALVVYEERLTRHALLTAKISHNNDWKLQALCAVNGHEAHRVDIAVCDCRRTLSAAALLSSQTLNESSKIRARLLLVCARQTCELTHISPRESRVSVLAAAQRIIVHEEPRAFEDEVRE